MKKKTVSYVIRKLGFHWKLNLKLCLHLLLFIFITKDDVSETEDGPASPVKMAKKVPVKKPAPVMSESEEVNSFQNSSLFSASGKIADYPKILAFPS